MYLADEAKTHKNNSGSLWKIVNNIVPSKEKVTQVYIKDLKIVVEEFNQYFTSVGRNTAEMASNLANENDIALSFRSTFKISNLSFRAAIQF